MRLPLVALVFVACSRPPEAAPSAPAAPQSTVPASTVPASTVPAPTSTTSPLSTLPAAPAEPLAPVAPAQISRTPAPSPADASALLNPNTSPDRLVALASAAYDRGDLATAHRLLTTALRRAPTDPAAHYALAVVLGRLRAEGQVCPFDATPAAILTHLETAVRAEPARLDRMRLEPDLASVHATARYQVLAGADLADPATLTRLLPTFTFYGPPAGVVATPSTLRFAEKGTVTRTDALLGSTGALSTTSHSGRWRLEGGAILVDWTGSREVLTLAATGALTGDQNDTWRDAPAECGA